MPQSPEPTCASVPVVVDLDLTLAPLRIGVDDPCWRRDGSTWWWATRTPDGPGSVSLRTVDDRVDAEAWGPGAAWLTGSLPRLVGASDPGPPPTGPVHELDRRNPGFAVAGHGRVVFGAIDAICRQGVSTFEAGRAWALMVEAMGDDAPGPGGVRLPPSPRRLASCDPYDLHVLGLDQQRADAVRRVASHATRLEADEPGGDLTAAFARLGDVAGVSGATVEHARAVAGADPDALPVLDGHTMALVRRTMGSTGPTEGSGWPERLERHRPHRGRLVRLLVLAGTALEADHPTDGAGRGAEPNR